MLEVEEQLRRYASATERTVAPTTLPVRRAVRGRSRWLAVAAAAAAFIGAVLVVALDDDEPRATTDPSTPTAPSTATTVTPDQTTTTGPATGSMRTFPVVAVIDCPQGARCARAEEYLVWAGEAGSDAAVRGDGFAVDLTTGTVRPIPPAPIGAISGGAGAWTGTELIVCCGTGQAEGFAADTQSAAAWDPDSGDWRVLARPPASIARSYGAAVWTGDLMVVVVGHGGGAATYDPATDEWEELAAPALAGRRTEGAWTGSAVAVWDSSYGGDTGWTWTPGDETWSPMPPLPGGYRTQLGSMAWTGTELVVWGQSTEDESLGVGARWRPGDEGWRPIASWPHNPVEDPYNGTPGSQTLVATEDGRVLVTGLGGSASLHTDLYDPASDSWEDLGFTLDGFHPNITIAGNQVLMPDERRPIVATIPPRSQP